MHPDDTAVGREFTDDEWALAMRDTTKFAIRNLHSLADGLNPWEMSVEEAASTAFSLLVAGHLPINGAVDAAMQALFDQMEADYLAVIMSTEPYEIRRNRVIDILARINN